MGGGAWPFLVGGASCLVDSVNERDLCQIIEGLGYCIKAASAYVAILRDPFTHWRCCFSKSNLLSETNAENALEVGGKNRSVMPFDVLGCTRATMIESTSFLLARKGWVIL